MTGYLEIRLISVAKMYIVSAIIPGVAFVEQIPQRILNVNHELLKNILDVIKNFINTLSNSCFKILSCR